jgi:hypothetical protein
MAGIDELGVSVGEGEIGATVWVPRCPENHRPVPGLANGETCPQVLRAISMWTFKSDPIERENVHAKDGHSPPSGEVNRRR